MRATVAAIAYPTIGRALRISIEEGRVSLHARIANDFVIHRSGRTKQPRIRPELTRTDATPLDAPRLIYRRPTFRRALVLQELIGIAINIDALPRE